MDTSLKRCRLVTGIQFFTRRGGRSSIATCQSVWIVRGRTNRERDVNAGAAARLGFDPDSTVMGFDDATDDGEAQAGSLRFGRTQNGRKGTFLSLLTHAAAGVFEFHRDMGYVRAGARYTGRTGFDGKRSALGHGLGGIED